ncbi:hypothetical protein V8C43DRAFT_305535 [Trichoderma afarasin]
MKIRLALETGKAAQLLQHPSQKCALLAALQDSLQQLNLTASLLKKIPEDHDHSMIGFLAHPQTSTERPPLGFRKIESEEEAKARVRTQLDAVDAVLSPSSNPPPNQ